MTSSARPHRRRWLLVLAAVAVLVAVALGGLALDRPSAIHGYKQIDERTIAVQTIGGPSTWTRLGSIVESSSAVTVELRSLRMPFAAGSGDDLTWVAVNLSTPLGDRQVIDASSGQPVSNLH